ncbi:MAG: alkaline phosphatase D family protein, partial [Candidatus Methylumidiphilus sp.]
DVFCSTAEVLAVPDCCVRDGGVSFRALANRLGRSDDCLSPGTTYYYRATDADGNRSAGQFATPAAAGVSAGLRLGLFGDWRQDLSPYPAINNAPGRGLDAIVKLGDTIYADKASADVPVAQASTLAEFRAKHNEAQSARAGLNAWANLNQTAAVYATIDDHEVANDFAGGAPQASDPRFSAGAGPLVNGSQLYQNGLQAFQEYMPIAEKTYSGTGDARFDGKPDLYRQVNFGRDAALFLLDQRSFRDQELPAANINDPASVSAFLANAFDPSRTLLGDAQMARLKADLLVARDAGVTWKLIALAEPIQNLGPLAGSDRYEGYAAERAELLGFIKDNSIRNVVFVSADIHAGLVNNLSFQTGVGGPQIAVDAFEVTVPAVAHSRPFGQTVVDAALVLGLITTPEWNYFYSLPTLGQDQFVKTLVDTMLAAVGYDPLGLDGSGIDATLLAGDYLATTTYGWTELEIAAGTQDLTVTTYALPAYTPAEIAVNGPALAAGNPSVISRFVVTASVPTPSTLALVLGALLGWAGLGRRR